MAEKVASSSSIVSGHSMVLLGNSHLSLSGLPQKALVFPQNEKLIIVTRVCFNSSMQCSLGHRCSPSIGSLIILEKCIAPQLLTCKNSSYVEAIEFFFTFQVAFAMGHAFLNACLVPSNMLCSQGKRYCIILAHMPSCVPVPFVVP